MDTPIQLSTHFPPIAIREVIDVLVTLRPNGIFKSVQGIYSSTIMRYRFGDNYLTYVRAPQPEPWDIWAKLSDRVEVYVLGIGSKSYNDLNALADEILNVIAGDSDLCELIVATITTRRKLMMAWDAATEKRRSEL